MPIINVVVPVWNRAHVIGRAVESAVTQKLPGKEWSIEILVVDDGSTDDLGGAIGRFGSLVTLVRHHRNAGAAAARNTGIAAAHGDYVAFLDSDDVWLPNKIAAQLGFMQSCGYAVSCTACELIRSSESQVIWPHYPTGVLQLSDIASGCILSPGTTMICQRSVLAETGGFDISLQRHEDWDWLLRLTSRINLAYLAEPLARRVPSAFANHRQTLDAVDTLRTKHLATLPRSVRRRFEAALAFETAAARHKLQGPIAAMTPLLKSVWLAPPGHAAVMATLSSRRIGQR